MPLYETMFDLPNPLSKLDTLVCDAFDAGAMENWGLITGRTSKLLFDPTKSGLTEQFAVVATVSHEAAHMWFGNLVTLEWWTDLWLNEAFATLMGEVVVIDKIEPGWNVHASYIKFHRTQGLQMDALRHSHPIEMACEDDSEKAITQTLYVTHALINDFRTRLTRLPPLQRRHLVRKGRGGAQDAEPDDRRGQADPRNVSTVTARSSTQSVQS